MHTENLKGEEINEILCSVCYEWTDSKEPCCGTDRPIYREDSINQDR
jgi:hypothetical protein